MYEHILVCTDGSDVAQKGVEYGLTLAKALGATATIVTVTERLLPYVGLDAGVSATFYAEYATSQKAAAEKLLTDLGQVAGRMGVEATTVCLEDGSPAEKIVETAKARDCSLIVMSSHGRRGIRRLILGSVTSEVLSLSTVPVLVVP